MDERQQTLYDRLMGRRKETRVYTINNSYGVYDYWKFYIHNRPKQRSYYKMSSAQYYKLLRAVNEYLIEILLKNAQVVLPNKMGEIVVLKKTARVRLDEKGKIRTNRPINWDATIKLWFEDPEAEKNKTLVRWDNSDVINIRYKKATAVYNNSPFYNLQVTRVVKKLIASHLVEGTLETPFFVDVNCDNIKALYNG